MIEGSWIESSVWGSLALLLGVFFARRQEISAPTAVNWLEHRALPFALFALGALAHGLLWGSLNPVAIVHDEASVLLQAQIFAAGDWVRPSPPLPAFFEQFHVLVEPHLIPKYPPGHALLLVPGLWLGVPALLPVMLNAMTGVLLFALVKRWCHPTAGLLAWTLWLIAPASLAFRPSYFSEVGTGLWLLAACWWLWNWTEHGRSRDLWLLSFAVAWSAISRPLTAAALAVPIAVVVLMRTKRERCWRSLIGPTCLGLAILGLMGWHNWKALGDPFSTPYALYSEVYFPFDAPGLETSTAPASRELPADMRAFRELYLPYHLAHSAKALPSILLERLRWIAHSALGQWWLLLGILGAGILWRPDRKLLFAVGSFALLVLAYLSFGHPPEWVLYYLEAQEILLALVALGVWRSAQWMAGRGQGSEQAPSFALDSRATTILSTLGMVLLVFGLQRYESIRVRHAGRARAQSEFQQAVARLPEPSIVFVRYGPEHDLHTSLITNVPDLEAAQAWIVYDRGTENRALCELAPNRIPLLFDEASGQWWPVDSSTGLPVPTGP